MSKPKRPIPPELGERFLRRDALAAGVTERRLRATDLEAPFRGVRKHHGSVISGVPHARMSPDHSSLLHPLHVRRTEHLELAQLYNLVAGDGSFFCGLTAAVVMGLPVPLLPAQPIEVGRLFPGRAPRAKMVRGIQIRPWHASLGTAGGLPVTSPATTWAMLARRLSLEDLVVLGDAIVYAPKHMAQSDRPPLATFVELENAASAPTRPGAPALRRALALIRDGSASPQETRVRLALLAAGLPEPILDVEVRDANGQLLGRSELAYPERRVAIEYESDHHRVDRRQWNRDIEKYQAYAENGWQVVRVTSHLLFGSSGEFVRQVTGALESPGGQVD